MIANFVLLVASPAVAENPVELQFRDRDASLAYYRRVVEPVFATYCLGCHGPKKVEGELALDKLDPDMKAGNEAARWAMLLEKLTAREMPPQGKPRPDDATIQSVVAWIQAEMKRSGKYAARRDAKETGNEVRHDLLFDPKNIPPFNAAPRVRRLSPEIYAGFVGELAKGKAGVAPPFTPDGKGVFKDSGAAKLDEPTTAQLIHNALQIAEAQTAHKFDNGKITGLGGGGTKEFLALLDPNSPPTDAQIEAAIVKQFETILRRAPTSEEKARFVAFMKKNIADAGQVLGVRHTLAAVLLLPEAIFRMEVGSGAVDERGRVRLSPREIAFAVAYALTDKRPDAELLTAAATGALDTEEGVAKQVLRLLDNPKMEKPRILRFFREYFGYDKALEVFKDAKDNPEHDPRILVEDTDRLILYVLEQDREVLRELLTTTKSFVAYKTAAETKKKRAEASAKFEMQKAKEPEKFKTKPPQKVGKSIYEAYGLTDFPDRQPVELPRDQRAGILTQPAWLVAHSTSFENQVIHRGKWIRERLLGGVVPDIPITVDAQLPDAPELPLRERLRVTHQAYCWKCHRLMNDLGLPFEQYDHFGRYRTTEPVVDKAATAKNVDKKGKPLGPILKPLPLQTVGKVDFVGVADLEGSVATPVELLTKLAASTYVEQVFVRHAFRYWLGRSENLGDAASLQRVHRAYRDSGGSMKALITALLTSESFLYRVPQAAVAR